MASSVPDGHEQDPSQVPELLSQIDQDIDRFVADRLRVAQSDARTRYVTATRLRPACLVALGAKLHFPFGTIQHDSKAGMSRPGNIDPDLDDTQEVLQGIGLGVEEHEGVQSASWR